MLINKRGIIPVHRSHQAIQRTESLWKRSGNTVPTISRRDPIRKTGAKAWTDTAVCHCPWIKRTIAELNPQPGHEIPSDDLMGHCQPGNPIAVSHTCKAATPIKMIVIRRSWARGAKTGVNKNFDIRCRTFLQFVLAITPCCMVEWHTCFMLLLSVCKSPLAVYTKNISFCQIFFIKLTNI